MTQKNIHNNKIETTLLRGRVRILQPAKGFHASMDTVFLAAATQVKKGGALLDIGCGVGSAGLCVLARQGDISLTGIDVQESLIALAQENAALNAASDRCRFIHGNILEDTNIPDNAFDTVMMNPPYQEGGTPSPDEIKLMAHGEYATGAGLNDWVRYAHRKVKNGGNLALVHRADRLDDVIVALTGKRWFGSLVVHPLWPHAGEAAKRVVLTARKERYAPLRLLPGLVLHKADGSHTPESEQILSELKLL